MEQENESVRKLWREFLKSIGEDEKTSKKTYSSWCFGENADELLKLVLKGEKTATTSLYYWYEAENEDIPKTHEFNIITDSNGIAKCITETIKVTVLPFNEVTSEFAFKEGEGDKSLDYWKRVHIDFFNNELKEVKMKFTEDMDVVCEEFRVVTAK